MKKKERCRTPLGKLAKAQKAEALDPEASGEDLLRSLLLSRARDVYVPPSEPWPEDPESMVHDVRIATRRLAEAVGLVQPMLGEKTTLLVRKDAKRLRRALGARREADVLKIDFERLRKEAALPAHVGQTVLDRLNQNGAEALAAARAYYTKERLARRAERVRIACRAKGPRVTLRNLAAPHLFERALAPEVRLEHLSNPEAGEAHHALRVDFKRLRYATEILALAFGDLEDFPDLLKQLKGLQDVLGVLQDANDLLTFLGRSDVRAATAEPERLQLVKCAEAQRGHRHGIARDEVLRVAPEVLARIRRTAGKMGRFVRAA